MFLTCTFILDCHVQPFSESNPCTTYIADGSLSYRASVIFDILYIWSTFVFFTCYLFRFFLLRLFTLLLLFIFKIFFWTFSYLAHPHPPLHICICPASLTQWLHVQVSFGVVISKVDENGAAQEAGLLAGCEFNFCTDFVSHSIIIFISLLVSATFLFVFYY